MAPTLWGQMEGLVAAGVMGGKRQAPRRANEAPWRNWRCEVPLAPPLIRAARWRVAREVVRSTKKPSPRCAREAQAKGMAGRPRFRQPPLRPLR